MKKRMILLPTIPSTETLRSPACVNQPTRCPLGRREIDIFINNKVTEAGVTDPGQARKLSLRGKIWPEKSVCLSTQIALLQMEGANGATNRTLGCVEYLPMRTGDVFFSLKYTLTSLKKHHSASSLDDHSNMQYYAGSKASLAETSRYPYKTPLDHPTVLQYPLAHAKCKHHRDVSES